MIGSCIVEQETMIRSCVRNKMIGFCRLKRQLIGFCKVEQEMSEMIAWFLQGGARDKMTGSWTPPQLWIYILHLTIMASIKVL